MTILSSVNNKSVMPGITPIPDVPDAPTIGTATAGFESATVTYTAATTGGTATIFTATSTPGSVTSTGSSPITVTGLTPETSYNFTVRASNSTGNSPFSAASNSVTVLSNTAFESIATVTVGSGGESSVTFSSIPQAYKHLQIRMLWNTPVGDQSMLITYNGVGGTSYASHSLERSGTGAVSSGGGNQARWETFYDGNNAPNSSNKVGILDIVDYTNTSKNKTSRLFWGANYNTTGRMATASCLFSSGSAISSITFQPFSTSFAQHTRFALYGIKG